MSNKEALDAISKKIRIKEEIDQPFDEEALKYEPPVVVSSSTEKSGSSTITYKLKCKDIGFNGLCQLNLGKAYKVFEDGRREKYPDSYKEAMDEVQLDFILNAIEQANNPIIVVGNIFTRVTTGNYKEVLPYKEQLAYIYHKLKNPNIKNKIAVLARCRIEKEIMDNGGPDLMGKLAKMLGLEDRLLNGDYFVNASVNTEHVNSSKESIQFAHFNRKINTRKTLAIQMKMFAKQCPGNDVYFTTDSKINWTSAGVTTYKDQNGETKEKPCWFVAFGPMYEYDKTNIKSQTGPYTVNKNWYKIGLDEQGFVRCDYVNYTFPQSTKQDTSSYTASIMASNLNASYQDLISAIDQSLGQIADKQINSFRKEVGNTIKTEKAKAKKKAELQKSKPKKKVAKKPVVEEVKAPQTEDVKEA